jgi:hypothetical protein
MPRHVVVASLYPLTSAGSALQCAEFPSRNLRNPSCRLKSLCPPNSAVSAEFFPRNHRAKIRPPYPGSNPLSPATHSRPVHGSPVSCRKPQNSSGLRRSLVRRDRKSGIFGRFGVLTRPQSPVAVFESPELSKQRARDGLLCPNSRLTRSDVFARSGIRLMARD